MLDLDQTQKSGEEILAIKREFVKLCDEFSEFNDYCSFFCASVSLQASNSMQIDKICAQGVERFAYSIRNKARLLDDWLQQINARMHQEKCG